MFDEDDLKNLIAFEKQILARICSNCHRGVYRQHHEWPHRFVKCDLCGFTKPTDYEVRNRLSEEKD